MLRIIPINLTILTIISCRQPAPFTADEKANVITEVRLTLNNYYQDIRKSGLTAEFNYLDSSAEFFWVPPGYTSAISYDSVAAILKRNAPMFKSVANAFDTLRIIPLSGELASYTGKLKSTMTDTSGGVMTYSLLETGLMIRRQNGWKLLSGQTSVLNP